MADNVAVTAGTGTSIAADEVVDGTLGTVKVQYVKLMDGTLDGTTKAAVGAAGLKVDGSGATQPVSGSLTTVSTVTSLTQMNGAAISMGTGVRGTGVQRVTIATDDVVPASQSGTWTVQPGNTANTTPWLTKIHDGTTAALVKAGSTSAAAASDPALVVTLRDVNANGQTTMSASAPVVIASDQSVLTTQLASSSNIVSGAITTAMTGTTTTSLVAAPGASLRNYITTIIVSNAHATVGTDVIIQDGSGGTTLLTIPAAAVYGGGVISLPVPLRQPTTNTALFCANVTTGASTKVSAVGFKGA